MGSTGSKDSRPIATNGIECGVSRKTAIGKKIRNSIEILWPSCLNLGYWSMSGKKVKSGMSDWMWPIESPFLPPPHPHPHPLIPTWIIISPPFLHQPPQENLLQEEIYSLRMKSCTICNLLMALLSPHAKTYFDFTWNTIWLVSFSKGSSF